MSQPLPPVRLEPAGAPSRRSFLRYSGASVVVGSLWLASCKKDDTVAPAPTITSFSPASAMAGTVITVTGTGFTGATGLGLGAAPLAFLVVNDTTITFTIPSGASTGPITIVTPGGTASTNFVVIPTPSTAPTVASFSVASGLPGSQVTVTGTNLANATGVTVNGTAATIVGTPTATSLTFTIPTSTTAGPATVVITNPNGMGTNPTALMLTVLSSFVSVGTGDAGVLNYAYALEQLEAAFYTQLRTGSYYTGLAATSAERLILDDLYYHEVIHREFLKAAITAAGAVPLKDLTPDFSSINFTSRTSVLGTAKAFEDLGVAAYNGAGRYINTPAYLAIAGKIVSVEARHAAIIRDLVSEATFVGSDVVDIGTANGNTNTSLEKSMTPNNVVAVANNFLAIGSKLNNPNTF